MLIPVWGWLWVALAASPPVATADADRVEAATLVDSLAWSRPEAWVRRFVRRAGGPDAVFADSWREGHGRQGARLGGATIYAVEATLEPAAILDLRQAVVWTHRGNKPVDQLVLRFLPGSDPGAVAGLQVHLDGRQVPSRMEESLLVVPLPSSVSPGQRVRLLITIDAIHIPPFQPRVHTLPETLNAWDIGAFGRARGVTNLGYWLPLVTPLSADGRFDERPLPRNGEHAWFEPAHFHVLLDVPQELGVATTGVQLDEWSSAGRKLLRFAAAGVREFTVQASSQFAVTEEERDGMRVRIWHPVGEPEMGRDLLSYALDALSYFEGRWGPLPFRELDLVDSPIRVALGMEYPQLLTVAVSQPGRPYRASEEHRYTVAHEVAHQWWYGQVGSDPREEPWVDEGLTVQSTLMYAEARESPEDYEARRSREILLPYEGLVAEGELLPASLPAPRYNLRQYSVLIYGKAALFLDEVRRALGDQAWDEAMRRYHRKYRMKNATGEDLLRVLRAVERERGEVDRLYRLWMEEVHHYDALLQSP